MREEEPRVRHLEIHEAEPSSLDSFGFTRLTVPLRRPVVCVDSSALPQSADPTVIKQSPAVVLRQHHNFLAEA